MGRDRESRPFPEVGRLEKRLCGKSIIMPKTVKVKIEKVCSECGNTYTGRGRSRTCSKVCAFWALFDKSAGPDACWPWKGHINPVTGYGDVRGRLGVDGKRCLAHRQAWRLHNCCDPDLLSVLHRCDNRTCGNPQHLRIGSRRANTLDALAKNRLVLLAPGEANPQSKLTDAAVRQIRTGGAAVELAERFGVSVVTIREVRRGVTWRHVQ
jgi:hypothetical protein